jgi:hypothetical protein
MDPGLELGRAISEVGTGERNSMEEKDFDQFVEAVQTVNLDATDTRATAHTAAVFASDWDRVAKSMDESEE